MIEKFKWVQAAQGNKAEKLRWTSLPLVKRKKARPTTDALFMQQHDNIQQPRAAIQKLQDFFQRVRRKKLAGCYIWLPQQGLLFFGQRQGNSNTELEVAQDSKQGEKALERSQEMKGARWMDIRSDRQKGQSYVELGNKFFHRCYVLWGIIERLPMNDITRCPGPLF